MLCFTEYVIWYIGTNAKKCTDKETQNSMLP